MNINNIKNLFRAYFIENWKRDLIWSFLLLAVITMLLSLRWPCSYGRLECLIALIMLFVYPERIFKNLHENSKNIHYLMIPANNREKVLVNIFLANVYEMAGLAFSIFVGYTIAYLSLKFSGVDGLPSYLGRYQFICEDFMWTVLAVYAALSVFFFGAVYFKKRSSLNTLSVCLAAIMILSFLMISVVWLNVKLTCPMEMSVLNYTYTGLGFSQKVAKCTYSLGCLGVIGFFYALSFIKMRETEA